MKFWSTPSKETSSKNKNDDVLTWSCKFCRVGVGTTHRCSVSITSEQLRIVWTSGLMVRERTFKPANILRASRPDDRVGLVVVHILTSPDSNGDSEYKQYDLSGFENHEGPETFEAGVNAIAFSHRPLVGRCLVFINPISGTRSGPKRFKSVHHLFHLPRAQVGLEFDAITTTHHGHASEVVASVDLDKYCAIISVSGDGTLQEIFSALIARPDGLAAIRTPVGCIPAGSEGTLAKISTFFNPCAAAYVILKKHEVRPLDVLEVTQDSVVTYSVCGVGWGIPGKMAEESEALRSVYGRSRYAVSALREFVNLKGCKGSLQVLPAKERPLCYCGPGCLRCRSGAEIALRHEQDKAREWAERRASAGAGGRAGQSQNGERGDQVLAFEEALCAACNASYVRVLEGKMQPCLRCGMVEGRGREGTDREERHTNQGDDDQEQDRGRDVEDEAVQDVEDEAVQDVEDEAVQDKPNQDSNVRDKQSVDRGIQDKGMREKDEQITEADLRGHRHVSGQGGHATANEEDRSASPGSNRLSYDEGDREQGEDEVWRRQRYSEEEDEDQDTSETRQGRPEGHGYTTPRDLDSGGRRSPLQVQDRGVSLSPEALQGSSKDILVPHGGVVRMKRSNSVDGGSRVVVKLDYNKRLQGPSCSEMPVSRNHALASTSMGGAGLGETSDRGSGLLHLAEQWRKEEEEARAQKSGKRRGEGVWQQLDGAFLAVGSLNTERISAPYVHMSDGCMDVIAVPAQVGRMDLLQMGFELPTGGHLEDRRIFHWKATEMRFIPDDVNDKFNVDGEVLDGRPIHIRLTYARLQVLPSLARVICAAEDPSESSSFFF